MRHFFLHFYTFFKKYLGLCTVVEIIFLCCHALPQTQLLTVIRQLKKNATQLTQCYRVASVTHCRCHDSSAPPILHFPQQIQNNFIEPTNTNHFNFINIHIYMYTSSTPFNNYSLGHYYYYYY